MMIDLKDLHDVLLEILLEFDRICKKYDICYSLAFGTLLGAIRHNGFIPWDDDVDVMMDRDNFDKFCEACKKENNKEFFFQTKETEKAYPYNICRLRKNNTAMIYSEWKNSGIHQGVYIDIYPLDYIENNIFLRYLQKSFIIMMTPIRVSRNKEIYLNGASKRLSPTLGKCKKFLYKFFSVIPMKVTDRIEDFFITMCDKSKSNKIGIICEGGLLLKPSRDEKPFSSEYMNEYLYINFEGHRLMASKNYKELLEHWYGDYMKLPPPDQRTIYHHPLVFDTRKNYTEYI